MAVQNQRPYPKTGEIWKHYCGKECLVLGILNSGSSKQPSQLIVAYEFAQKIYSSNVENKTLESTLTTRSTRFWRPIEEFMDEVVDRDGRSHLRFEFVPDDISAEIWERSFAIGDIAN